MAHNEIAVSPDFDALEVVAPAEMDTVAVDDPTLIETRRRSPCGAGRDVAMQ